MFRYIVKRLIEIIPIIFVVSLLIFFFIHLVPGDPVRLAAGKEATLEEIERVRQELGWINHCLPSTSTTCITC